MPEFKTKEESGTWKLQCLKEAKENRKEHSQALIESAADSKPPSQTRMRFSDVLPLFLMGVLAAVFVFSVLSPVTLK
jgi:hypothetical protein